MSLMRWFRRNNKKMMAFVVIVLMFVFVGSAWLSKLGRQQPGSKNELIARYAKKSKITNYDFAMATKELEVLTMLGTDRIYRPNPNNPRTQSFSAILLGELLFAEDSGGEQTSAVVKQFVSQDRLNINSIQVNDIYRKAYNREFYWIVLRDEAINAGLTAPLDKAKEELQQILPAINRGQSYSQAMQSIISWSGFSEEQIFGIYSNFIGVIQYAAAMCSNEVLTTGQLKQSSVWGGEQLDIEYVSFMPLDFIDGVDEPTDSQVAEQFNKYKGYFPGEVTEDNPHGFGYKLFDSIQLEYFVVKLSDVSDTVEKPTQQEVEQYYERNRASFVRQVPSDPNDPNSVPIEQAQTFAEVATLIENGLQQRKVSTKAEQIIQEAVTATEIPAALLSDPNNPVTPEELKENAADYQQLASSLKDKYGMKIYTGTTGLLNASHFQSDPNLGSLYIRTRGSGATGLMQLAFAVDPINVSELGPFDASKPMLYQSIGPVRDARGRYGSLDALLGVVRVIAANKAMEPESQDYTFSVSGISFGGELKEDDAYSVRDKVVEDLKKIVAAKEARQKAEVFLEDAQANGWDETADKFDELYAKDKAESDSDIKQFQLITRNGMTRIPDNVLDNLSVRNQGNPGAKAYSIAMMVEAKRVNQFYSLIPADSNSITAPTIIDFAPGMHSYCIKSLSVKKVYAEDFRNQKAQLAFMEDRNYSQMLALVHYNPKNILQRNNFQLVERKKKAADKQIAEDVNDSTDE